MEEMGGWDNMTVQQKIDEVKNKFLSIAADIAEVIMPALNKIADFLGEEGNIQIALGVIGGLFAVTLVGKVGRFVASFARIGPALAAVVTAPGFLLFMKAMAPILLIAATIKTLQETFGAFGTPEPERTEGQQRIVDRLTGRGYFLGAPKPGEERPSYAGVEIPLKPQWPLGPSPMVPGGDAAREARERLRRTGIPFAYPQGTFVPGTEPADYLAGLPRRPVVPTSPALRPPAAAGRFGGPEMGEPGSLGMFGEAGGTRDRYGNRYQGGMIPGMAEGGIVREPTLAVVGEAGPEAVIPLDKEMGPQIVVNVYPQAMLGTKDELLRDIQEGLNEAYRRNPAGNFRFAPPKRV